MHSMLESFERRFSVFECDHFTVDDRAVGEGRRQIVDLGIGGRDLVPIAGPHAHPAIDHLCDRPDSVPFRLEAPLVIIERLG